MKVEFKCDSLFNNVTKVLIYKDIFVALGCKLIIKIRK